MKNKIPESELASFANVSERTIRRWKKNDLKKYDLLIKKFKESDLSALRTFLKENHIELMGNFGIYFTDIDDYSVGILAEDTNHMITRSNKSKEDTEEIIENLKTLKEWL